MTNTSLSIGAGQLTAMSAAVDSQLAAALFDEAQAVAPIWGALIPDGQALARVQIVVAAFRHAGMDDDSHVHDAVLACAQGDVPVPLPKVLVGILYREGVTRRTNIRDFTIACQIRSDRMSWHRVSDGAPGHVIAIGALRP